jgi:mRNA interferase RelE/StbE
VEVIIKNSFGKALKSTPKHIQEAVREIITETLPNAKNLETSGLDYTRMEGQKKGENFFRIRIGDWRMGVEYVNPKILLITILTRGNIYKQFPRRR